MYQFNKALDICRGALRITPTDTVISQSYNHEPIICVWTNQHAHHALQGKTSLRPNILGLRLVIYGSTINNITLFMVEPWYHA